MPKSKVRKPRVDLSPKKGRHNAGVSADQASHSAAPRSPNGLSPVDSDAELVEKIKELVRLAQEQGRLTYNDISEALPESAIEPEKLDQIFTKLRSLDIEIVDQAEVDRVKTPGTEEENTTRLDILDDPVRMYLKQMGQVALLTREQEVEISKRIEAAENEVRKIIYSLGFAGKEHIALAEKLLVEPPRERFDRVILDKKVDNRNAHLRALRRLVVQVREIDQEVDEKYTARRGAHLKANRQRAARAFKRANQKLQDVLDRKSVV